MRVGDVYGIIIEHYARQQNYTKVSTNKSIKLSSNRSLVSEDLSAFWWRERLSLEQKKIRRGGRGWWGGQVASSLPSLLRFRFAVALIFARSECGGLFARKDKLAKQAMYLGKH